MESPFLVGSVHLSPMMRAPASRTRDFHLYPLKWSPEECREWAFSSQGYMVWWALWLLLGVVAAARSAAASVVASFGCNSHQPMVNGVPFL